MRAVSTFAIRRASEPPLATKLQRDANVKTEETAMAAKRPNYSSALQQRPRLPADRPYGVLLGVMENSRKESNVGHDAAQVTIDQSQPQPVL